MCILSCVAWILFGANRTPPFTPWSKKSALSVIQFVVSCRLTFRIFPIWVWFHLWCILPQVTTYDHCFTIVSLHPTLTEFTLTICSRPIFNKSLKRSSILVADILTFCSCKNLQYLPTYGTSGAFPFGRLTCVLSALPISPWSIRPRNRLPSPAPALSGRLQRGWCCFFLLSNLLLYLETHFRSGWHANSHQTWLSLTCNVTPFHGPLLFELHKAKIWACPMASPLAILSSSSLQPTTTTHLLRASLLSLSISPTSPLRAE